MSRDTGRRPVTEDALAVAVEHVAWCLRRGDGPYDVFAALGEPAPLRPSWGEAIWELAKAQAEMRPVRRWTT